MATLVKDASNERATLHNMFGLVRHRELIWQLTKRELSTRYKGSYLGVLWSFIVPLTMLLVYTFVFSVVFKGQWGPRFSEMRPGEFALTLFAGLIPFNLFAEVVNRSPNLILNVPNYVKKVVFPLEILPVVSLGAALIHSLIAGGVFLLGSLVFLKSISPTIVLLPLAYLPLLLLSLGLSWFLSALGVYIRDVGQVIGVFVQILFFMSPVFYPVSAVPQALRIVLLINPLTTILDSFRAALLWQETLPWGAWGLCTAVAAAVAVLGYIWFARTKPGFADVM